MMQFNATKDLQSLKIHEILQPGELQFFFRMFPFDAETLRDLKMKVLLVRSWDNLAVFEANITQPDNGSVQFSGSWAGGGHKNGCPLRMITLHDCDDVVLFSKIFNIHKQNVPIVNFASRFDVEFLVEISQKAAS